MTETVNAMTLSDADFRKISAIAAHEAGLAIPEAKKSLVQSRVARRMRALGIDSSGAYLDSLEGDADETENLISALTTNVSHFFREKHHFEFLSEKILNRSQEDRFRIWSAGCSKGQEPYSLAIQLLKEIPDATKRDILILASDIDKTVLAKAK
ncbi:MAG: CheR family methyltransferase, partial [Pseudomonadota bacterium]